ncbi:hypothetical protein [Bacillus weihaiensis]|uniref:hypothetical protein n=1 Tax=Bacillus weihaiensis TaxID=1547283 RepID=UPI0023539B09|nr:hypothetical protein [Bacillus weihaiensis]
MREEVNRVDPKLTKRETGEVLVQSLLQLIPYVGGTLSTLYFGTKQEKRFKRLESFYRETAEKLNKMEVKSIEIHDFDTLYFLIEKINEKVEVEHRKEKQKLFQNFFINTLKYATDESNSDERLLFLDILENLRIIEINILTTLYSTPLGDYGYLLDKFIDEEVSVKDIDHEEFLYAFDKLKSYRLIRLFKKSYPDSVENGRSLDFQYIANTTSLGERFVEFCMKEVI